MSRLEEKIKARFPLKYFYNKKEIAKRLGVHRNTINNWVKTGMLLTDSRGRIPHREYKRINKKRKKKVFSKLFPDMIISLLKDAEHHSFLASVYLNLMPNENDVFPLEKLQEILMPDLLSSLSKYVDDEKWESKQLDTLKRRDIYRTNEEFNTFSKKQKDILMAIFEAYDKLNRGEKVFLKDIATSCNITSATLNYHLEKKKALRGIWKMANKIDTAPLAEYSEQTSGFDYPN